MNSATTILEQHGEWMRRLALELVDDPNAAADAAQDTCLAVLRAREPVSPREPRRWLATVLRNFVRQRARSERRRLLREALAARPERLPSTAELVERLSLQRRVADAVAALAEPYRTTILLRFLEGLDTASIAERTGRAESTVRTHVERGLERLRRQFERACGGRRNLGLALLGPAALAEPAALALPSIGLLLMKSKTLLVSAALLLAVVTTAPLLLRRERGPGSSANPPVTEPAPATSPATEPLVGRSDVRDRAEVPIEEPRAPAVAGSDSEQRFVAARVVAVDGQPIGSATVRSSATGERFLSADDGSVQVVVPDRATRLRVDAPPWATVLEALVDPDPSAASREPIVVAARAIALAGVVVDPEGRPLQRVRVQRALPRDLRARLGLVLDHSIEVELSVETDREGHFAFAVADAVPGAALRFTCDGYLPSSIDLPMQSSEALRIALDRPDTAVGSLLGVVQDRRGWPVEGAVVALGRASIETAADGRFALQLSDAANGRTLRAMKRGLLPVVRALREDEVAGDGGATPFVVLELGGEPLSIAGRIATRDGRPIVGAKVWATDVEPFGRLGRSTVTLEGYLGGGLSTDELMARVGPAEPSRETIEAILRDTPTAMWNWVRTDDQGRFELGGLLDREYHLAVMADDTLARSDFGPFQAGLRGLDLWVDDLDTHAVVAGRIVSRDGQGVAGASVAARADALVVSLDGGHSTTHAGGVATTTDDEGRFRLERVGRRGVYLRIESDRLVPLEYGRGVDGGLSAVDGRPVDDLVVTVSVRVHARIELVDPAEADAIAVENQAGDRRIIELFKGRSRQSSPTIELADGKTPALALTDDVVRVVLLKHSEVVRRVAVTLDPNQLTVLRL